MVTLAMLVAKQSWQERLCPVTCASRCLSDSFSALSFCRGSPSCKLLGQSPSLLCSPVALCKILTVGGWRAAAMLSCCWQLGSRCCLPEVGTSQGLPYSWKTFKTNTGRRLRTLFPAQSAVFVVSHQIRTCRQRPCSRGGSTNFQTCICCVRDIISNICVASTGGLLSTYSFHSLAVPAVAH